MSGLGLFGMLQWGENFAPALGLDVPFATLRLVRNGAELFATIGTVEDHVSRVIVPPPDLSAGDRRHLEAWAHAQLVDLEREYSDPWRRWWMKAATEIIAAAQLLDPPVWPPLSDSGREEDGGARATGPAARTPPATAG